MDQKLTLLGKFKIFVANQNIIPFLKVALNSKFLICIFTGCSSLCLNGQIVGRTAQYGIEEVEVATATIDLEDIRSYRNSVRSRNIKAASAPSFPRIDVTGFALSGPKDVSVAPSKGQFRLIS